MNVDTSGLVPEAQRPAREAAEACLKSTGDRCIALVAVGSVVKGGFIPGWSDIDILLYLTDDAFDDGTLHLPLALTIQRSLANVEPAPFQFISCLAVRASDPRAAPPLVHGAYVSLAGIVPSSEATPEELRAQAREWFAAAGPEPGYVGIGLLEHGGGRLPLLVRRLCGEVWRALFHALALTEDPILAWTLPKPAAVEMLPGETASGRKIRAFYRSLTAYQPHDRDSLDAALRVLTDGLAFLRTLKAEAALVLAIGVPNQRLREI
ncbi:MAG: nucleotidyltransferase domain-containing protein [Dehalococcoidia bacterium]